MLGDWGRQEWTPVDGYRVHAAVGGRAGAPSVVLVHGLGVSHRYFRPLARELGRDLAVAAPDLPGYGRTAGPRRALDVRELSTVLAGWLRETGRAGSVIVGNSAGCQFAVDLACHAPEVMGPMVLVGPTFDRTGRTVPAQAWRLTLASLAEAPSLIPVLAQDYLVCGPRRFLSSLRLFLDDRIEDKLDRVPVPTVLVRGEHDAIAPRRWADELGSGLRRSRAVEVPGAGHALNWTAPGPVADVVRGLVAGGGTP